MKDVLLASQRTSSICALKHTMKRSVCIHSISHSARNHSFCLFPVHSQNFEIHCITKWKNLQSERIAHNRFNVPRTQSDRDTDSWSTRTNLTADFTFSRRIFYVNILCVLVLIKNLLWTHSQLVNARKNEKNIQKIDLFSPNLKLIYSIRAE